MAITTTTTTEVTTMAITTIIIVVIGPNGLKNTTSSARSEKVPTVSSFSPKSKTIGPNPLPSRNSNSPKTAMAFPPLLSAKSWSFFFLLLLSYHFSFFLSFSPITIASLKN